jgi:hypothetical protein
LIPLLIPGQKTDVKNIVAASAFVLGCGHWNTQERDDEFPDLYGGIFSTVIFHKHIIPTARAYPTAANSSQPAISKVSLSFRMILSFVSCQVWTFCRVSGGERSGAAPHESRRHIGQAATRSKFPPRHDTPQGSPRA